MLQRSTNHGLPVLSWICRPIEVPALQQSTSGYRYSVDAILLAQIVWPPPSGTMVDLGTGNGVVLLLVLAQAPSEVRGIGMEIQASLLRQAKRNGVRTGMSHRVQWIHGDVRCIRRWLRPGAAEVVVCNPPYRPAVGGRLSPVTERALARHELSARLGDFLRAARYICRDTGRLHLIYPYVRHRYLASRLFRFGWYVAWLDMCYMERPHRPVFLRLVARPGYAGLTRFSFSQFTHTQAAVETTAAEPSAALSLLGREWQRIVHLDEDAIL